MECRGSTITDCRLGRVDLASEHIGELNDGRLQTEWSNHYALIRKSQAQRSYKKAANLAR